MFNNLIFIWVFIIIIIGKGVSTFKYVSQTIPVIFWGFKISQIYSATVWSNGFHPIVFSRFSSTLFPILSFSALTKNWLELSKNFTSFCTEKKVINLIHIIPYFPPIFRILSKMELKMPLKGLKFCCRRATLLTLLTSNTSSIL